jgi:hypothetical protein
MSESTQIDPRFTRVEVVYAQIEALYKAALLVRAQQFKLAYDTLLHEICRRIVWDLDKEERENLCLMGLLTLSCTLNEINEFMSAHTEAQENFEPEDDFSQDDDSGGDNCGFTPMETPADEPEGRGQKRKLPETETQRTLKEKINRLICRYPGLQPRISTAVMARLDTMNEKELENILANCLNDVADLRGTPSAESIITVLTHHVDARWIPNFTETCLNDLELNRDIEAELLQLLGNVSNRLNIVFRFFNNAYNCTKKRRFMPEPREAALFKRQPNATPAITSILDEEEEAQDSASISTLPSDNPFAKAFVEGRDKQQEDRLGRK